MCKCCKAQVCCCCGPAPCALFCPFLPSWRQSRSTRIMYVFFLTVATLVSCLMLAGDVQELLIGNVKHLNETCIELKVGENCNRLVGYLAVYRVSFTMVVFHVSLMLLMICVSSSQDCRAGVQNGFWFIKALVLVGLCVGAFCIPQDEEFSIVWMYVGMVGGILFIILQMFLIVDFAHVWHRNWSGGANGNRAWCCALYFCATVFLIVASGAAVALYLFYVPHELCTKGQVFVLVNAGLCLVMCFISVLPCTKRVNSNAGLLQPTIISVYVMYLTWSALISIPAVEVGPGVNGYHNLTVNGTQYVVCGPRAINESWQKASGYIGAVLMLLMAIYASWTTSKKNGRLGINNAVIVENNDVCCCCCPGTAKYRTEKRGDQGIIDDEAEQVVYNYSFFHFVFAIASLYIMMQLTMWYNPKEPMLNLKTYGMNWPSAWIKMASSWICIVIYVVTLLCPRCLPGLRSDGSDSYSSKGMLV